MIRGLTEAADEQKIESKTTQKSDTTKKTEDKSETKESTSGEKKGNPNTDTATEDVPKVLYLLRVSVEFPD